MGEAPTTVIKLNLHINLYNKLVVYSNENYLINYNLHHLVVNDGDYNFIILS